MGRLILRLLGTPEVSHAEHPLTLQTRKVLALLAYLAVEHGVHSRDKITALLWPESDEERGKASLRRALAYLR
jgi:DNA-binding SARP family transcriptional activator